MFEQLLKKQYWMKNLKSSNLNNWNRSSHYKTRAQYLLFTFKIVFSFSLLPPQIVTNTTVEIAPQSGWTKKLYLNLIQLTQLYTRLIGTEMCSWKSLLLVSEQKWSYLGTYSRSCTFNSCILRLIDSYVH